MRANAVTARSGRQRQIVKQDRFYAIASSHRIDSHPAVSFEAAHTDEGDGRCRAPIQLRVERTDDFGGVGVIGKEHCETYQIR